MVTERLQGDNGLPVLEPEAGHWDAKDVGARLDPEPGLGSEEEEGQSS